MTTTIEPPRSNPVRGPLNAGLLRGLDRYMHSKLGAHKQRVFTDLPSRIVEIGAGTGANFRYLRPGTTVIAVEPNPAMVPMLRSSARRWGIDLDLRQRPAEDIDLPDGSVDAVICSLVLCTVGDPAAALSEIRRILAPGGRFAFVEHVAGHDGTAVRRVQRLVRRPWRWLWEGCEVLNATDEALAGAGFGAISVERFVLRSVFVPVRPQIAGTATA